MISPHTLHARATAILTTAGGEPPDWHTALANPTAATLAARNAYIARASLFHAREYMWFIRHARDWPIERFAHNYRPHKRQKRTARGCVRAAAHSLAEAERFLEISMRREAA